MGEIGFGRANWKTIFPCRTQQEQWRSVADEVGARRDRFGNIVVRRASPLQSSALPILTGSATDGEMQNGLLGRFRPRMLLGIENGGRESTDDLGDISGFK